MKRGLLFAGVCLLLFSSIYAYKSGQDAGSAGKERISLVWPNIMEMQERDRAFIVGLGITCNVHLREKVRVDVVSCLREAATDPNVILPTGIDKIHAPLILEDLLRVE